MFRSARSPCKACDGTSPSSADSTGCCILGNLIKELLKAYCLCLVMSLNTFKSQFKACIKG